MLHPCVCFALIMLCGLTFGPGPIPSTWAPHSVGEGPYCDGVIGALPSSPRSSGVLAAPQFHSSPELPLPVEGSAPGLLELAALTWGLIGTSRHHPKSAACCTSASQTICACPSPLRAASCCPHSHPDLGVQHPGFGASSPSVTPFLCWLVPSSVLCPADYGFLIY